MQDIGIGLLGFGTIGAGVVEGLQRNGALLASRLGVRAVLRRIADLDIVTDRGVAVAPELLTTDAFAVVDDPAIDVVIELIGGTTIARELVLRALSQGKAVVTANKKLLAEYGPELYETAARHKADIYFGASVGGTIPIVRALREGLIANRIEQITAILNGTCNYILTCMEEADLSFDEVLRDAQRQGFAEADPGLDIDGFDTAHKAAILASIAYDTPIRMSDIHVEGIRGISAQQILYAGDMGYRIKLLAIIRRDAESASVEVRVHPALVPHAHMLASVNGVFNAVMVRGDLSDDTLYYGRGAGRLPTASTVLADMVDVIRNIVNRSPYRLPPMVPTGDMVGIKAMADVETRFFLQLTVADQAGVLAGIATRLGAHNISIASVLQPEGTGVTEGVVPLIITTHRAREQALAEALAEIDEMPQVKAPTERLRIEDA